MIHPTNIYITKPLYGCCFRHFSTSESAKKGRYYLTTWSLNLTNNFLTAPLRMLIDCETTDSNTRTQEVTKINKSSQEPQTVPEQVASIPFGVCSSRSQGPQAEIDTNNLPIEGERKGEIPLNEDMLNVIAFNYSFQHAGPSEVEETEGVYRKYLEKVREIDSQIQSFRSTITLECGTLQFLEELWLDYSKGHLNEMVRTLLVTKGILKDFGLATVKLYITIMDEEYRACREYLLNRTGMSSHVIPTWPVPYG